VENLRSKFWGTVIFFLRIERVSLVLYPSKFGLVEMGRIGTGTNLWGFEKQVLGDSHLFIDKIPLAGRWC
jgi:hypothetical protein